jgi:hypothetical protein
MQPSFRFIALALACVAARSLAATGPDTVDPTVTYRCPNNEYKNTISAREAERLGCKTLAGTPITIIQTSKPRPATGAPPAAGSAVSRVDPVVQRARDSDARRILESELKSEEQRLAELEKEYNGGDPERLGNERNYQKYQDRVAELKTAIERKQADIAALRRELAKLPPAPQ